MITIHTNGKWDTGKCGIPFLGFSWRIIPSLITGIPSEVKLPGETKPAFHYRVLYACWNALKMTIAPQEILGIFALQECRKWLTGKKDFPLEGVS